MREHKDSSASWVRNPRLMTPRTRRPRWLDSLALGLHSLHHLPQSTLRALTHHRRRMCRRTRPDAQGAPAASLSDVLSRLSFPAPSLPHRNLVSQYSPRVSATSPNRSDLCGIGRRSASAAQRVGGEGHTVGASCPNPVCPWRGGGKSACLRRTTFFPKSFASAVYVMLCRPVLPSRRDGLYVCSDPHKPMLAVAPPSSAKFLLEHV